MSDRLLDLNDRTGSQCLKDSSTMGSSTSKVWLGRVGNSRLQIMQKSISTACIVRLAGWLAGGGGLPSPPASPPHPAPLFLPPSPSPRGRGPDPSFSQKCKIIAISSKYQLFSREMLNSVISHHIPGPVLKTYIILANSIGFCMPHASKMAGFRGNV